MTPGLIVAAPASGSGKTVLTLGLLSAFRRRGLAVGAFKVGPDYIDPGFLRAAAGRPCRNLDPWAMRPESLAEGLAAASAGADLVLGEGVMGLFDGAADGSGSTADLAVALGLPVLLLLDVRGQGASAAAVALGCQRFRPELELAGVVANRVGGAGHRRMLAEALAPLGLPLVGYLPRAEALELPSRHLGLVQAEERSDLQAVLDRAAGLVEANLDLDLVRDLARRPRPAAAAGPPPLPPLGQRIAVARDQAFAFAYEAVLSGWRRAGAELGFFSPLANEAPAPAADAVYLPGGYPELHAERLAGCRRFLDGLGRKAADGAAIYGECGGYMVLGRGLVDADGHRHAMAGLLPLETSFAQRQLHLGYRRIELLADSALGPAGARFRGHEFHYATVLEEGGGEALFRASDARAERQAEAGLRQGPVMGSFLHLIDAAR
jgi:cobyrinic acid a,c-diamide synthase